MTKIATQTDKQTERNTKRHTETERNTHGGGGGEVKNRNGVRFMVLIVVGLEPTTRSNHLEFGISSFQRRKRKEKEKRKEKTTEVEERKKAKEPNLATSGMEFLFPPCCLSVSVFVAARLW